MSFQTEFYWTVYELDEGGGKSERGKLGKEYFVKGF